MRNDIENQNGRINWHHQVQTQERLADRKDDRDECVGGGWSTSTASNTNGSTASFMVMQKKIRTHNTVTTNPLLCQHRDWQLISA